MNKVFGVALALAVSLALGATPAAAIVAADFSAPFMPPDFSYLPKAFFDVDNNEIAYLTVNVWGVPQGAATTYIYGLTLNPGSTEKISSFGTAFWFGVPGLVTTDGSAGWSYSDAATAGSGGDGSGAFRIDILESPFDPLQYNIVWITADALHVDNHPFWDADHLSNITFFFTSTSGPGPEDSYCLTNDGGGCSVTTGPGTAVPEPSSLLLLASGLLAFGFVRRSFRKFTE